MGTHDGSHRHLLESSQRIVPWEQNPELAAAALDMHELWYTGSLGR